MMKRPTPYALAAAAICLMFAGCSPKEKDQPPEANDPDVPDSALADLIEEQEGKASYARIVGSSGETVLIDFKQSHHALSKLYRKVKRDQVSFAPHLKGEWQQGPHSVLIELHAADANKLFDEHVDLELPVDGKANSAIVRRIANQGGIEIAFMFGGSGNSTTVNATIDKLRRKWKPGSDDSLWMPSAAFLKNHHPDKRNIPMGSFAGEDFTIALWVDPSSTHMLVSFRQKPEAAEAEGG